MMLRVGTELICDLRNLCQHTPSERMSPAFIFSCRVSSYALPESDALLVCWPMLFSSSIDLAHPSHKTVFKSQAYSTQRWQAHSTQRWQAHSTQRGHWWWFWPVQQPPWSHKNMNLTWSKALLCYDSQQSRNNFSGPVCVCKWLTFLEVTTVVVY